MIKRIKRGFTVFELIIAIAVIAALSAVLVPSFIGLTAKTKLAQDKALLNNLNNALTIYRQSSRRRTRTMHDAVLAVERGGYTLDKLVTTSDQDLVFSVSDYRFHLSDDIEQGKEHECFKIYSSMPNYTNESRAWSIYANNNFEQKTVSNLTVGFDVGYNKDIEDITYTGSEHVCIRTFDGKLTINTSAGGVSHFGKASVVDILEVSNNSYFEEGNTDFIRLLKGRVVVTSSSNVKGIHILQNNNLYTAKVAIVDDSPLPDLTRDKVSEDSSKTTGTYDKYICELQHLENRDDAEPDLEHLWLRVNVVSKVATPTALISSSKEEISEIPEEKVTVSGLAAKESLTVGTTPQTDIDDTFIANGYVLKSGNVYYETLEEGLTSGSKKQNFTVIANNTISSSFTVSKTFTLDLNGKTVTAGANTINFDGADATINNSVGNGTITGSATPLLNLTNSSLTVNGGTIKSTKYVAVYVKESDFKMTGGRLEATRSTLTLESFSSCDISGGTITTTASSASYYGIYCGTQTLNTGAEVLIHGNAIVQATKGYGIRVKRLRVYESASITAKYYAFRVEGQTFITGGTIKSNSSYAVAVGSGGDLSYTGGILTSASGYEKLHVLDNTTALIRQTSSFTRDDVNCSAIIYEKDETTIIGYGSAYGLSTLSFCSDKVIKLYKDISLTAKQIITISKSIVLDLNGHNITQPNASNTSYLYLFKITATSVTIKGNGICSFIENDALAAKVPALFYMSWSAVATINIEGGTYIYNGNTANRNYFRVAKATTGTSINMKAGIFGDSTYSSNAYFFVASSYVKKASFKFTGGSYYNFDPSSTGLTYMKMQTGYSSVLNSETGYYDIVANS